jgi:hypothetical protein
MVESVYSLGFGLDSQGISFRFPQGEGDFPSKPDLYFSALGNVCTWADIVPFDGENFAFILNRPAVGLAQPSVDWVL